jgi:hypothetical protein
MIRILVMSGSVRHGFMRIEQSRHVQKIVFVLNDDDRLMDGKCGVQAHVHANELARR